MFKINTTLKLLRILDSQLLPSLTNMITEYMGDDSYYIVEFDHMWSYTRTEVVYGTKDVISTYAKEKHGNHLEDVKDVVEICDNQD